MSQNLDSQSDLTSTQANIHIFGATHLLDIMGTTALNPEIVMRNDFGIAIAEDKIIDKGDYQTLRQQYPQASCNFYKDQILMPGLVNCHGHAAMSLLRGIADDRPLADWLQNTIWPLEQQWVSESFVRAGTLLSCAEMLRSGTTTFSDMYFFPESVAQLAEQIGMRCQINFPILEFPTNWANDAEEYIHLGLALRDQYKENSNIEINFGAHAPYTVSDQSFTKIITLAEETDARIQIHLHETAQEVEDSINERGKRPIQRLKELGLLGEKTQAVHLTQLNNGDIDILAQHNVSAIHCPISNLKLASGYSNIQKLIEAGVKTGLGTDGAASSNSLNIFEACKTSALLAKFSNSDATSISASQALFIATLGGAQALGIDGYTGSLDTDKKADFITVDLNRPEMQPCYNPISNLVYCQAGNHVSNSWINGKQVMRNRKLCSSEFQSLTTETNAWQERISTAIATASIRASELNPPPETHLAK